jgi:hypothetical protein
LRQEIGNEDKTSALIATSFWQAFVASPAAGEFTRTMGIEWAPENETIVVSRADLNRFDLLVLVDAARTKSPKPLARRVEVPPEILRKGWYSRKPAVVEFRPHDIGLAVALEALAAGQPFSILVAKKPPLELTGVPRRCSKVRVSGVVAGTIGVVAIDERGRKGVTTALHVVEQNLAADVDGVPGRVVKSDPITDSCFIQLSTTPQIFGPPPLQVLRGKLPRGQQAAVFDGANSGRKSTTITGWSPELPEIRSHVQTKVYTTKVTDPGDSGAALVSDDGYIVGFAMERTGYGAAMSFSSWIWAHSVYEALHLQPI